MRTWIDELVENKETTTKELVYEAWSIIHPALFDQDPNCQGVLDVAKTAVVEAAKAPTPNRYEPSVYDAQLTLATWPYIEEAINPDMPLRQKFGPDTKGRVLKNIAQFLRDTTMDRHKISNIPEPIRQKTLEALLIGIGARHHDHQAIIPSAPWTHNERVDNPVAYIHNVCISTRHGPLPIRVMYRFDHDVAGLARESGIFPLGLPAFMYWSACEIPELKRQCDDQGSRPTAIDFITDRVAWCLIQEGLDQSSAQILSPEEDALLEELGDKIMAFSTSQMRSRSMH